MFGVHTQKSSVLVSDNNMNVFFSVTRPSTKEQQNWFNCSQVVSGVMVLAELGYLISRIPCCLSLVLDPPHLLLICIPVQRT